MTQRPPIAGKVVDDALATLRHRLPGIVPEPLGVDDETADRKADPRDRRLRHREQRVGVVVGHAVELALEGNVIQEKHRAQVGPNLP
jgi:hypothetical protein